MNVIELLHLAKLQRASDLHLAVNRPPILRIDGVLSPIEDTSRLTVNDLEEALSQVTTEDERSYFNKYMELDFGYSVQNIMRIRANAARQRGTISLSMRIIPPVVPTLDEMNLPEVCKYLITRPRGMVIVSGPTGSGKSTTLAAMIQHLNNNCKYSRVVTIEDPVEYVYTDNRCTIIQRELGGDTLSFAEALKHVLRQDPDVILVGEIRDAETASAALILAETGHLVLTTGHAPSAPQTVERMIDLFPSYERPLVQARIASLLVGILNQTLVTSEQFKGRVPAMEVMLANTAIRNQIREGKIHQLYNTMRTNTQDGMQLLDHSLADLYKRKLISGEKLLALCNDRTEVERVIGEITVKKIILQITEPQPGPLLSENTEVEPVQAG